ncbi:hypothetical protein AMAG_06632 [Allomyces macrogynus ATCC 38327]|uniref:Transcription initiation factor IIA subunit 2 n=1 Tax=Allomyces macrogynus (strain ATCC 38327) TaxID=578462 RepID=A0A0L0SEK5_ALLM3|nr:Transcription initiation factor IIA small chain (TFIIA 13.5 kDa subunit) [Allomyces javanicus]KAJ3361676.1 Transcription initiation factor IIA small chain (TFIIA 13.5 kDa subunit) [Allomyces arbusculus]KNE60869.1 hypothetical protein AMAG_06632 [Allomyces macrogynus ATCC 38327]|eukprot:KNE60869.1 hypothetical protein AMAG_06632 [Allomyces macrogynus ATCC 38327]
MQAGNTSGASGYMHYRNSTLGTTLMDALDEMIHTAQIQPAVANRLLEHFDKTMCESLARISPRASFRGSLSTYRNCDEVWTFFLRDVQFKMEGGTVHADKVRIIACKRPE